MTTRTITEILDRDDDEMTSIQVAPDREYVEIQIARWTVGDDRPMPIRVLLERDDAVALLDAIGRCIGDIEASASAEEADHE